jgi:hypothetical protein
VLPNGELPCNHDDILVDVQSCPHKMMLPHHRITAPARPYSSTGLPASTTRPAGNRATRFALTSVGSTVEVPGSWRFLRSGGLTLNVTRGPVLVSLATVGHSPALNEPGGGQPSAPEA